MKKQIVITGIGLISAAGEGIEALWEALLERRSLVGELDLGQGPEAERLIGAHFGGFDAEKYVTQRKSLKVMARDIQMAVGAASLAVGDSGLNLTRVDHQRIGVIAGSGILNQELDELAPAMRESVDAAGRLDLHKFGSAGISALFPLWLLKYLPNMSACHISILFDLQGINNSLTTGASCGLQAIGEAFRVIERGDADCMLAGGAESRTTPGGLSRYQILKQLVRFSPQEDPGKAYRPFDAAHPGFAVGEGAVFLMLEELGHAKARGARIYARVGAFGSSYHEGQVPAMSQALREAGATASDIRLICGCGLGTAADDAKELAALEKIFGQEGERSTNICFSKPVIGFTGYASGAIEAALAAISLKRQTVPPSVNAEAFVCKNLETVAELRAGVAIERTMANAFGLGGQSASLILNRWDG
ncbi:MAG: beta-ketoacyl-[acyl-carrier-protein] synthase family protein [Candidatus Omnitrophota bacterium]